MKGSIEVVDPYLMTHSIVQQPFIQAKSSGHVAPTARGNLLKEEEKEILKSRGGMTQSQLGQRLIEVLVEEEDLSINA